MLPRRGRATGGVAGSGGASVWVADVADRVRRNMSLAISPMLPRRGRATGGAAGSGGASAQVAELAAVADRVRRNMSLAISPMLPRRGRATGGVAGSESPSSLLLRLAQTAVLLRGRRLRWSCATGGSGSSLLLRFHTAVLLMLLRWCQRPEGSLAAWFWKNPKNVPLSASAYVAYSGILGKH